MKSDPKECLYCQSNETLHNLMIEVAELSVSRVFIFKEQTYRGRCLVPYKSKNLLVAGRAISSTHQAHSSVRVMPITSCIGEAAGIAAALACETGCEIKDVPVARLHAALDKYGGLY